METVSDFIFLGCKINTNGDCSHEIKTLAPWKYSYDKPRQCIKKQRHRFADIGPYSPSYDFSSNHVWTIKKAEHQRIDAFELWYWSRLLKVPWTSRRSNQPILKISPGCSLVGLMFKLKLQYFGHLMRTDWLIWKDPDAGKDWMQEEKGPTEDEMVGWHHWLDGHEFEQALGVGDGQGGLACCSPWGRKESDMTELLNWIFLSFIPN